MNYTNNTNNANNKKKGPISNTKIKIDKIDKLLIKYIQNKCDRNKLSQFKKHFYIYDHGKLTITCADCGHNCVCCENSHIYHNVDDFINHLKIIHKIT